MSESQAYSIMNNIGLKELKDSMLLLDYTAFSKKYAPMDELTCKWIQHNFNGSKAEIIRDNNMMDVLVVQIRSGDSLCRIYQLPQVLKKLQVVNSKLVKELGFRGFLKFKVKMPTKQVSAKQQRRHEAVQTATKLVEQVTENTKSREEATKAVESFMDKARSGKTEASDVINYVDTLTESTTPEAMSAIASLKASDQTYAHCVDVAAIFQTTYFQIIQRTGHTSVFTNENQAMLSSFMHDFGKSQIPKDILDSTKRFDRDSHELKLMQSHPVMGAELLTEMDMPDYIVNMSKYHHVKMDTSMKSSYPPDTNYDNVIMETRLLSIIDVYQALIGKRSYKKSWTPAAAVRYLDALAGIEFDPDSWNDFVKTVGIYPISSLVKLNDGSLAFVLSVPKPDEDEERPQVAVVRNPQGEDLTRHLVIDLKDELDVSITGDVDHQEVFDNALELFSNLKLV